MLRKSQCPQITRLAAAVVCALAAFPAAAQIDAGEKLPDELVSRLTTDAEFPEGASLVSAEVIEGSPETVLVLTGDAEIRRTGERVKADKMTYTQETDVVTAEGNALVSRDGTTVKAPSLTYKLDEKTGTAQDADYEYAPRKLRGKAKEVCLKNDGITELSDVFFTTCPEGDKSWWIEMNKLTLDQYDQEGYGTGAVLKVAGGVPVMGSPWFTFPLTNERKSGLLTPTLGWSSEKGTEIALPYYFNIAPNYDYTLTPRLVSKRGVMLGNEGRFKWSHLEGTLVADYMPHDRRYDDDRFALKADVKGAWNGFGYGINYNRVSDKDYIDDFASDIRTSSDNIIAQDYWVTYGQKYWNTSVRVDKHQALRKIAETSRPYEREPQFNWNAYVADLGGLELSTHLEATRYRHAVGTKKDNHWKTNGERYVAHQQVSYPMAGAGWFFTPKTELIASHYSLDHYYGSHADNDTSITRTVPIFSADAGLIFERNLTAFGRDTIQTLEPRLFYAYIPYRKHQDAIPLFDTSAQDVSFGQLFQANEFAGYDRVSETNQISGALTTRFIDSDTGVEWVRAEIGQRYYFNDQRVGLDGQRHELNDQRGDLMGSVATRLTRSLSTSAYAQYSYDRKSWEKANAGIRWQPKPMSVMSLYYRYNRATYNQLTSPENYKNNTWGFDDDKYLRQIDFSVQWPLSERWYILARQNYALDKHRFVDALVGLEHRSNCWTARLVAQRYLDDYTDDKGQQDFKYNTTFFFQVELTGLGSVGSSPLETLQRSIRGYQTQTPTPSTYGTYDYYQ